MEDQFPDKCCAVDRISMVGMGLTTTGRNAHHHHHDTIRRIHSHRHSYRNFNRVQLILADVCQQYTGLLRNTRPNSRQSVWGHHPLYTVRDIYCTSSNIGTRRTACIASRPHRQREYTVAPTQTTTVTFLKVHKYTNPLVTFLKSINIQKQTINEFYKHN